MAYEYLLQDISGRDLPKIKNTPTAPSLRMSKSNILWRTVVTALIPATRPLLALFSFNRDYIFFVGSVLLADFHP